MSRRILSPPREGNIPREDAKRAVQMTLNKEYKQWKENLDLTDYTEEAVKDELGTVVDFVDGNIGPAQLKKIIHARALELAHIYEGWSD